MQQASALALVVDFLADGGVDQGVQGQLLVLDVIGEREPEVGEHVADDLVPADTLARLDLPIKLGEDAGVVLDAVVAARDEKWHLAHMEFAGGRLWVRDHGLPTGHRARVRILARDVSLARTPMADTSILNTLPAIVVDSVDDAHPALTLVKLRVGESPLLARLTRRSAHALELAPGQQLFVQIKAVALIG